MKGKKNTEIQADQLVQIIGQLYVERVFHKSRIETLENEKAELLEQIKLYQTKGAQKK